ncbi:MAG: hypothetical protein ACK4KT_05285 [Thermaurantimonas sp.]
MSSAVRFASVLRTTGFAGVLQPPHAGGSQSPKYLATGQTAADRPPVIS